jgi:hypothetical protein
LPEMADPGKNKIIGWSRGAKYCVSTVLIY